MVKTAGSYKVVIDQSGAPWLVVGQSDGSYEAQRLLVIERTLFPRSWQAVDHVKQTPAAERRVEWQALSSALEAGVSLLAEHRSPHAPEHPSAWWEYRFAEVLRLLLQRIGGGRVR